MWKKHHFFIFLCRNSEKRVFFYARLYVGREGKWVGFCGVGYLKLKLNNFVLDLVLVISIFKVILDIRMKITSKNWNQRDPNRENYIEIASRIDLKSPKSSALFTQSPFLRKSFCLHPQKYIWIHEWPFL